MQSISKLAAELEFLSFFVLLPVFRGLRCAALWEVCQPFSSWSFFRHVLQFSRDRQCHETRESPHRPSSLYVSSGEPTLAADVCQSASRMRRNCGDAVAHHSTHNTKHHTRTYSRQQLAHKQSNTTKRITHQPQRGRRRRRRCARRPLPGCQVDRLHKLQVPCCRHSQVWSTLGSASSASRVRAAQEPSPSCICRVQAVMMPWIFAWLGGPRMASSTCMLRPWHSTSKLGRQRKF